MSRVFSNALPRTTGGLLLLVQEDPDDRALYAEQFRALGFTVFEFGDGGEALSLLYANRPRVIVLDVVLPTIDGPELCRKARDLHGDRFSILFLSTLQDIGIMEMCFEAGGNDYLVKNPDPRKVMDRVVHWSKPDAMRNQEKDRKLRLATLQTANRIPNSVIDDESDGLSSETDKQVAQMLQFINKAQEFAKPNFGKTHEEKLFLLGYVTGTVNYWGTVNAHMQQHRARYLRAVLRETGIFSNHEIRLVLGSLDVLSEEPIYSEAVTRGEAEAVTGMLAGRNALPMAMARFGQREH